MDSTPPRLATLVDWYAAPDWVTVDQSAFLLGVSPNTVRSFIDAGDLQLVCRDEAQLIAKHELRQFWESNWNLAHVRRAN